MLSGTAYRSVTLIVADFSRIVRIIEALIIDNYTPTTPCKVVLKEGKPGSLTSDQAKTLPAPPALAAASASEVVQKSTAAWLGNSPNRIYHFKINLFSP